MNHPQSLAIRLYEHFPDKKLKEIKDYACCAFVLMWCLGIEPDDDGDAINTVARMIENGAIEEDCTVKWADAVKFLTGRTIKSIDFVSTTKIWDIKGRTPVKYEYNGKGHWVGVENGVISFNPLEYSTCVAKGKPTQKRIIHIDGVSL